MWPVLRNLSLATFMLVSLSSCQYKWGYGELSANKTIAIPYIQGDWDGSLTATLVQRLSQSGILTYSSDCADYTLFVKVLDFDEEDIGFRYETKKNGELKSSIIPDETRLFIWVEVRLVHNATSTLVLGPVCLEAEVEFDHEYYYSRNAINVFSLGQLTDYDEAYVGAMQPLNRRIAQKIVDYILAAL